MNRFDLDWRYVRRYTVVPLLSAVSAILVLGIAFFLRVGEVDRHAELVVNHGVLNEDYDALVYRRRLVDRYHRRYEQFAEIGFVGRERRLDWVETLRETAMDLTIPRVSYAIEPQLRVIAPVESLMSSDDISIHLSRLRLEVGLVHEHDLLHFFDTLQRKAPGLIQVEDCSMDWQADESGAVDVSVNIVAECAISIFSIVTSDVVRGVST